MHVIALVIAAAMGWQGKVHFTHDPPRKSGGSDGAIHVSEGRVRLEEPTASGPAVILFDGKTLRVLFPEEKTYVEMPRRQAALATVPPLSTQGMRAVGKEVVDGRACVIWEKKGAVTQRIWVPIGRKPFLIFLRAVTRTNLGATQAEVTDIKISPQPAALFRVPKGYRKQ